MEIKLKTEVPILLLTGYLGSGKTTLLNRILNNERGIKFAVIVNDIGEVNIDARLIEQGGVVGQKDDSLVALQNGCICCTLKMDLVEQLADILRMRRFDYIVIEASGICEPGPIAQTICNMDRIYPPFGSIGRVKLDCIVTIVDALRMKDEFAGGLDLLNTDIDEEDIENLVIQQIEFCNIVLLNKASEVSPEELHRLEEIVRALQPQAEIIPCDYGDVPFEKILNTDMFDFDKVATSARWISEVEAEYHDEDEDDDDDDHDDHDEHDDHHHHHHHLDDDEDDNSQSIVNGQSSIVNSQSSIVNGQSSIVNGHHHHHHDDEGEAEEYGIGTFVYYRRQPFDSSRFDEFVARFWPKSVIRAKGICYFVEERDICYVFEQAGKQVNLRNAGQWYATMSPDELADRMDREPGLRRDWDDRYGDRMQKLVFIGQHLDKEAIAAALDKCLVD